MNQAVGLMNPVASAIKLASAQTGVDFSYLVKKADVESSLNPTAKSTTSSASGLYQFVEQTWLRVVKAYGEKYGLAEVADKISVGNDGVARVRDTQSRQAILSLRKDPTVSAQMAAELTNENRKKLQEKVGGKIGDTELYLAHFLGAGGAAAFIREMRQDPSTIAANVLPTAASANSKVFYDKEGNPRTLKQVYANFAKKFEKNDALRGYNNVQVADASTALKSYTNDASMERLFGNVTTNRVISEASSVSSSSFSPSTKSGNFGLSTENPYYATMVLAQMNLGDLDALTSSADATNTMKKKGTSSTASLA